jgi:copper homeostasis protein (lipoprotein)
MRKLLSTFAVATAALLALSACKREPAPVAPAAASVAAPATVAAMAPSTVAAPVGVSDNPAPGEHTTFDAKAFAGTFADEGMTVTFASDGTYTLDTHAADQATGTWSLEPDARHIRLDPNSKAEQDRVYLIATNDELHAEGGTQVMRRQGAAQ